MKSSHDSLRLLFCLMTAMHLLFAVGFGMLFDTTSSSEGYSWNRFDLMFVLHDALLVLGFVLLIAESNQFTDNHHLQEERYLGVVCILSVVLSFAVVPWKYHLLLTVDR